MPTKKSSVTLRYVTVKLRAKRSIFITPELLVRIEQNQRHSIGNEKEGIESANKKILLGINMVLDPLSLLVAIPNLTLGSYVFDFRSNAVDFVQFH